MEFLNELIYLLLTLPCENRVYVDFKSNDEPSISHLFARLRILSYIGVDMREQKQGVCRFQIKWWTQY